MSQLKSLWDLLGLRRAILLTQYRQDPFDQLDDKYKEHIELNPTLPNEKSLSDQDLVDFICKGKKFVNFKNLCFLSVEYFI